MATLIEAIKAWRRRKFVHKCACASHDPMNCASWIHNKPTGDIEPCDCVCHKE